MDLRKLVFDRISLLGLEEASKFFGVSQIAMANWANGKTRIPLSAAQLVVGDVIDQQVEPIEDLAVWAGRKVAVLYPVYRTFNPDTHFTLFANYAAYGPEKIAMPKPIKGTCIWEARNRMLDKALKIPDCETFLMGDDDMVLPFGQGNNFRQLYDSKTPLKSASFNAISRLMSHPKEIGVVGALYFGRHAKGRAQCQIGFSSPAENEKLRKFQYKGLLPMEWVGTGLIRIQRWAVERLKSAIDEGKWPDCKPRSDQGWYGYFNPLRVGVGEDVSFGRRCSEIGIKSYLDTELHCLHMGEQLFGAGNTSNS